MITALQVITTTHANGHPLKNTDIQTSRTVKKRETHTFPEKWHEHTKGSKNVHWCDTYIIHIIICRYATHTRAATLTHSGPEHSTNWTMEQALQPNPSDIPYYELIQLWHETWMTLFPERTRTIPHTSINALETSALQIATNINPRFIVNWPVTHACDLYPQVWWWIILECVCFHSQQAVFFHWEWHRPVFFKFSRFLWSAFWRCYGNITEIHGWVTTL